MKKSLFMLFAAFGINAAIAQTTTPMPNDQTNPGSTPSGNPQNPKSSPSHTPGQHDDGTGTKTNRGNHPAKPDTGMYKSGNSTTPNGRKDKMNRSTGTPTTGR